MMTRDLAGTRDAILRDIQTQNDRRATALVIIRTQCSRIKG